MKATLKKRTIVIVVGAVICAATWLIGENRAQTVTASTVSASTVSAFTQTDTVLISCVPQANGGGIVVASFEKSLGAPRPPTTSSCAQILTEYMNQGFRIQKEDLDAFTSGMNFHLIR
jgi:hypothetical protein